MRVLAHVAFASAGFGLRYVIFRYEDGTTKRFVNGRLERRGLAASGPTWWRDT